MTSKKIITYVGPMVSEEASASCTARLMAEFPLTFNKIDTVHDLFALLSDPKFHTDFINIDAEGFFNRADGTDAYSLISTIATLIKCTVSRTGPGKPVRRTTKLLVMISDSTPIIMIKEFVKIPDVILTLRLGNTFTCDDIIESVGNFLAGNYEVPKKIKELIRPKKTVVHHKEDGIQLTPRQQQILHLIATRGASNKVIAKMLNISESTVKLHITAILKKHGVRNRTQLALAANASFKA